MAHQTFEKSEILKLIWTTEGFTICLAERWYFRQVRTNYCWESNRQIVQLVKWSEIVLETARWKEQSEKEGGLGRVAFSTRPDPTSLVFITPLHPLNAWNELFYDGLFSNLPLPGENDITRWRVDMILCSSGKKIYYSCLENIKFKSLN